METDFQDLLELQIDKERDEYLAEHLSQIQREHPDSLDKYVEALFFQEEALSSFRYSSESTLNEWSIIQSEKFAWILFNKLNKWRLNSQAQSYALAKQFGLTDRLDYNLGGSPYFSFLQNIVVWINETSPYPKIPWDDGWNKVLPGLIMNINPGDELEKKRNDMFNYFIQNLRKGAKFFNDQLDYAAPKNPLFHQFWKTFLGGRLAIQEVLSEGYSKSAAALSVDDRAMRQLASIIMTQEQYSQPERQFLSLIFGGPVNQIQWSSSWRDALWMHANAQFQSIVDAARYGESASQLQDLLRKDPHHFFQSFELYFQGEISIADYAVFKAIALNEDIVTFVDSTLNQPFSDPNFIRFNCHYAYVLTGGQQDIFEKNDRFELAIHALVDPWVQYLSENGYVNNLYQFMSVLYKEEELNENFMQRLISFIDEKKESMNYQEIIQEQAEVIDALSPEMSSELYTLYIKKAMEQFLPHEPAVVKYLLSVVDEYHTNQDSCLLRTRILCDLLSKSGLISNNRWKPISQLSTTLSFLFPKVANSPQSVVGRKLKGIHLNLSQLMSEVVLSYELFCILDASFDRRGFDSGAVSTLVMKLKAILNSMCDLNADICSIAFFDGVGVCKEGVDIATVFAMATLREIRRLIHKPPELLSSSDVVRILERNNRAGEMTKKYSEVVFSCIGYLYKSAPSNPTTSA